MAENTCFLSLSIGLRLHNTGNQGNIYMEICKTILCINNIRNLLNEGIRGLTGSSSYLNLKFHFTIIPFFFTAFNVAIITD